MCGHTFCLKDGGGQDHGRAAAEGGTDCWEQTGWTRLGPRIAMRGGDEFGAGVSESGSGVTPADKAGLRGREDVGELGSEVPGFCQAL